MLIRSDLPCPCGQSSDAFAVYSDGGHCFSCNKHFDEEEKRLTESQLNDAPFDATKASFPEINQETYTRQFVDWRGIRRASFEFYGAHAFVAPDGEPKALAIPYGPAARNLRNMSDTVGRSDKWKFEGDAGAALLCGQDKFAPGSALAITICEGGLDAISAFQMLGSKYPVVGVRSSSTAVKECSAHREYLNSFSKIYLCLDNDKPGQEALHKIAKLFDFDKVWHVKLGKHNDVNDYLTAGDVKDYNSTWWNARKIVPEGIVASNAEVWDLINSKQKEPLAAYPWPTLQDMTYGLFSGQFVIIKAPTKVGKTEFISHIEYEVLKNTDHNIGVIHIEDRRDITPKRYATYELGRTCHLPDSFATNDEIFEAYQRAVRRDGRVYYYSHFGSKDPEVILDTIRYLVTVCGCKFIFLDHITLVISGLADDDERRALDRIATSLATMTNDLDFCCVAITHVNDNGQSRGSRTIEHTAHTIITLARDKAAEDETERNTTRVAIEGNRICGLTGPAGKLIFDRGTWRMSEPQVLSDELTKGLME